VIVDSLGRHHTSVFRGQASQPQLRLLSMLPLGSPTYAGTSSEVSRLVSAAVHATSPYCIRAGVDLDGACADGVSCSISIASVHAASPTVSG
jgi:hypothetical protein